MSSNDAIDVLHSCRIRSNHSPAQCLVQYLSQIAVQTDIPISGRARGRWGIARERSPTPNLIWDFVDANLCSKLTKFIATCTFKAFHAQKTHLRPGLFPGPNWGSFQYSPSPLLVGRGVAFGPSPPTPPPISSYAYETGERDADIPHPEMQSAVQTVRTEDRHK